MIEKFSDEYVKFLEKNKLLPLIETAKVLNLHPATLRSFAKSNQIKHVRIGKKYYFNIEDIKNDNTKETVDKIKGVIVNNGYIKIYVGALHPSSDNNGYVMLSRLVMESMLLNRLNNGQEIFYKDGNIYNNQVSNLEIK